MPPVPVLGEIQDSFFGGDLSFQLGHATLSSVFVLFQARDPDGQSSSLDN
jgi:hypothetical protein